MLKRYKTLNPEEKLKRIHQTIREQQRQFIRGSLAPNTKGVFPEYDKYDKKEIDRIFHNFMTYSFALESIHLILIDSRRVSVKCVGCGNTSIVMRKIVDNTPYFCNGTCKEIHAIRKRS